MRTFSPKPCRTCGQLFQPKGTCAFFCPTCAVLANKRRRREADIRKYLKLGRQVGVGKGGANAKGSNDDQFKTGVAKFHKDRERVLRERKCCERCSKNVLNVGWAFRVVHHRDHDRSHNEDSNYELLCKRCHQIEHKCWLALQKRNDYPLVGVGNSVPEAQSTL